MQFPERDSPADITRLADEQLVALSHDCAHRRLALHTLLLRCWEKVHLRVAWLARRYGLPQDQVADAQQDAVFVIVEAADSYDAEKKVRTCLCPFHIYLGQLVRFRFYDFLRKRARDERFIDRSSGTAESLIEGGISSRHAFKATDREREAGTVAIGREFQEQLEKVLRELDVQSRWLWEQSVAGASLHALAEQLGVPCRRVKHQRHKIRAYLAERLQDWHR
jgi:RNA polymerase sigma factor (sigma-70 family)